MKTIDQVNTHAKTFDNMPQVMSEMFDQVISLRNEVLELKLKFEPQKPVELLTAMEVAEWLKCDLSTIHNWKKKKILIPYGIGSRVYYKRSEIEAALVPFGKK